MIKSFNVTSVFFPEMFLVTTAIQQLIKQILQYISKYHVCTAVVTVYCSVACV